MTGRCVRSDRDSSFPAQPFAFGQFPQKSALTLSIAWSILAFRVRVRLPAVGGPHSIRRALDGPIRPKPHGPIMHLTIGCAGPGRTLRRRTTLRRACRIPR